MTARAALDRTLLLMRDFLKPETPDDAMMQALISTRVALVSDRLNLSSHSGQSAFVSAAILAARSGAEIHLVAPRTNLIDRQPPLHSNELLEGVLEVGADLIPGVAIHEGESPGVFDAAVLLGNTRWEGSARQVMRVGADDWNGSLSSLGDLAPIGKVEWPFGGLVAAALACSEIFKVSMRKLREFARDPNLFDEYFAPTTLVVVNLSRQNLCNFDGDLGRFDLVSAGAISHAVLFALSRIPDVRGQVRIIDPETSEISNLNRYALLRRSRLGHSKVADLAGQDLGLSMIGHALRFERGNQHLVESFARAVLVGVDHIPTRWDVQSARPDWLAIGATTHYSAMASFHDARVPCAACLHPVDDDNDALIPTVAFVSFWAGLMLASLFVRHLPAESLSMNEQQLFFSPLRPESGIWMSPVFRRDDCLLSCAPLGREASAE